MSLWPLSWTERGKLRMAQDGRVRRCGLPSQTDPSIVASDGGSARWDGVWRCGSTWQCPVCSTIRRQEAAADIAAGLKGVDGTVQMVTLTIRHEHGTPLETCLAALDSAWRETRHDGTWCRWWRERVLASARAVEITRGSHGWHPHIHLLTLLDGPGLDEYERDRFATRWQRAASRGPAGSTWEPTWLDGVHVSRPVNVSRETSADDMLAVAARYVTKAGLEISGQGKGASPTSLWRVAERAARGDKSARATWRYIGQVVKGRHAMHLDSRMRAVRDDAAERRRAERPQEDATRYRVPFDTRKAFVWAECAWHPAALRVPVALASQGADVSPFIDALCSAHVNRNVAMLTPWVDALRMPL